MQARRAALLTLVFVGVLFESFPVLAQVAPMPNRSRRDSGVDIRTHKLRPVISPDVTAVDASGAILMSAAAIGPSAARQMASLLQDKQSRTGDGRGHYGGEVGGDKLVLSTPEHERRRGDRAHRRPYLSALGELTAHQTPRRAQHGVLGPRKAESGAPFGDCLVEAELRVPAGVGEAHRDGGSDARGHVHCNNTRRHLDNRRQLQNSGCLRNPRGCR